LTAPLGETITDAKILMVPVNGGDVQTVADLPFDEIGGVAMAPDGRRFIVTVYSSRSDVWVVDNFDGSPERRIPRESSPRYERTVGADSARMPTRFERESREKASTSLILVTAQSRTQTGASVAFEDDAPARPL
jgi:hypothetical protein